MEESQYQQVLREKLASGLADESDVAGIIGANNVNTRVYQASSVDTSSATFSFTPSRGSLMSRRVIMEYPVIVTHTVGGGQLLFQPSFAPKHYAGLQAVRQFSLTLNNTDFKSNPADLASAWSRYHLDEDQIVDEAEFMASPDYQDMDVVCPPYGQVAAADDDANAMAAARLAASVHDRAGAPFAISDFGCYMPNRASERHFVETGAGGVTVTRIYTMRCPVFLNDLLDMSKGRTLANVTSFDLNVDFQNNIAFSCFQEASSNGRGMAGAKAGTALYNQAGAGTSIALTAAMATVGRVLNNPAAADFKLYVSYFESPVQIPKAVSYEFSRFESHSYTVTESGQAAGAMTIGGSATTLSGDLSFSMVPKAVYVYVSPRASGQLATDSRCFCKTTSLEINLGSQRVNYQNPEEIREVCLENGMHCLDLHEYNGVVKLVYGKDLPMPDTGSGPAFVGAPVACQLNLQATHQNLTGRAKNNMQMHIVVEYPSRVTFEQNLSETIQGLTGQELQSLQSAPLDIKTMIGDSAVTQVQGGKLRIGKIKSFIKKHFTPKGFHKAADGIISVLRKAENVLDESERVAQEVQGSVGRIQGRFGKPPMSGGQLIGGSLPIDKSEHRYLKFK